MVGIKSQSAAVRARRLQIALPTEQLAIQAQPFNQSGYAPSTLL
jgi:hypothetical protein